MDFAMFRVGGFRPWDDEPTVTPRRRTIQAFRILSFEWLYAEPALHAIFMGKALGASSQ
jgi:hypothetical protein